MPNKDNIYAGFFIRLAAYIVDIFIVFTLTIPLRLFLLFGNDVFSTYVLFKLTLGSIIIYLITTSYFIITTYFLGGTIGKIALGLRVQRIDDTTLNITDVIVRETFAKYISGIIINIGYFLIGFDSNKQGLHDKICDTCVIYKNRIPNPVIRNLEPQDEYSYSAESNNDNTSTSYNNLNSIDYSASGTYYTENNDEH